jgi:di/tricarboxylate transporter
VTQDQITLIAILLAMLTLFIWGRWRHDFVAIAALLAAVIFGFVSPDDAFNGFGHPAVITVAGVLILSGVLQTSGAADMLTRAVLPRHSGRMVTTAALVGLAAGLSAFMNNVGALALLMPVALQISRRLKLPPGQLLMPLSFGSILGGMTTLIGTPPNLIVSGFRAEAGAESFAMFDFAPVGLAVAAAGIIFISLIGWRLIPVRERAGVEGFVTSAYLAEARVPEDSKSVGLTLGEVEDALEQADAQVVALVRNELRMPAPDRRMQVRAGDILLIEAEPGPLAESLSVLELALEEEKTAEAQEARKEEKEKAGKAASSDDIVLVELAMLPGSTLVGRSVSDIHLRHRYGINLLAVSRQGRRTLARLRTLPLQAGDVLLLQGETEAIGEFSSQFGCVPLAERTLQLPRRREALIAGGIMAMGVVAAAFGLIPAAISFAAAALLAVVLGLVSPRKFYDSIDWPVIVLLGALIPVALAVETTGTAALIADALVQGVAQGHAVAALVLILIVTMTLSDFMNNAATAAVMCPIAIGTAATLEVNPDAFLMSVAIGASCAFLTPIGHQNNTLILGPGGFRFGDYWRLGLPLEVLVIAVSVPMLLLVWPLR